MKTARKLDVEDHGAEEKSVAEGADGEAKKTTEPARKTPTRLRKIVLGGVVALITAIIGWYLLTAGHEGTDDAQVDAEVVPVPAQSGGTVQRVLFVENQPVKRGDLLVELDPRIPQAKLAQAEAELMAATGGAQAADAAVQVIDATARGQRSAAEAMVRGSTVAMTTTGDDIAQARAQVAAATAARRQAELDLERARKLFAESAVPKQRLDAAQNGFDSADANLLQARARLQSQLASTGAAEARVSEAKARLGQSSSVEAQIAQSRAQAALAHARVDTARALRDLAALELEHARIVAPSDGVASKKGVVVGQMVATGQPVAMLVPVHEVWITANFKETQLSSMKVGQPVHIKIDAYPGLSLHGEVESFSGATGSRFSLLPAENATGNFTKVVQRVPVRVKVKDLPANEVLRPGMSAEVTVDVRS